MRIQISTNVSQQTRDQANELIAKCGYSLRDVVTLGVELLYQERMGKMSVKRISKEELHEMERRADSVTGLPSGLGTYDALVWVDGKVLHVTTESLNPIGDVKVEEINDDVANKLMGQ